MAISRRFARGALSSGDQPPLGVSASGHRPLSRANHATFPVREVTRPLLPPGLGSPRRVFFPGELVLTVSIDEILQAAKLYLATSSHRELLSILGSTGLALISITTAVLTYLSNRTLTGQVETTRGALMDKEIELVRLKAETEERHKALARFEDEIKGRAAKITVQEEHRTKLLDILKQSDEDVWIRHLPLIKTPDHDAKIARRKPIVITVANNKGGVGKSTVTLNMAAYFDKHQIIPGRKRLLIDMDYQGTTSYVLTKAIDVLEREVPRANADDQRGKPTCALQRSPRPQPDPAGKRTRPLVLRARST